MGLPSFPGGVWLVDFEFYPAHGREGNPPVPVCMVACEITSGRTLRRWQDELARLSAAPFPTDASALLVANYAPAEMSCFIALGWPVPANVLDLFIAFRRHTNGKRIPAGNGRGGTEDYTFVGSPLQIVDTFIDDGLYQPGSATLSVIDPWGDPWTRGRLVSETIESFTDPATQRLAKRITWLVDDIGQCGAAFRNEGYRFRRQGGVDREASHVTAGQSQGNDCGAQQRDRAVPACHDLSLRMARSGIPGPLFVLTRLLPRRSLRG